MILMLSQIQKAEIDFTTKVVKVSAENLDPEQREHFIDALERYFSGNVAARGARIIRESRDQMNNLSVEIGFCEYPSLFIEVLFEAVMQNRAHKAVSAVAA